MVIVEPRTYFMAEQSLKDKTVKGVAWSGIDNVIQIGVTFVVSIVLARLLSPDDYGLLGLIAVFTAVCQALISGGYTTALIRKKEVIDDDYNTVFIINFGMSLLLYAIIYFSAPAIANFFERQELVALTRVSSIGMIVGALALVQQTLLTKRIDFKTQTKVTTIASVTSGVIGIVMALFDFGVWALVAQQLSATSLRTILLWIYNKWIPKFRFSSASFHELFGFGWKMMVSVLLDTIWKELYQVVVGKFYTPATLGQYTRAKQFSQLFSSNLTGVVQRVTFPVLSNIQDEHVRLVSAYRRIIKTTMFITAISLFFIGAISEPLLYCLIGPKWHEATAYLPLICIGASLYPLHALNLNMLQVQGRSDLFLGLEIIKKVLGLIPLAVCIFYGVLPMLYINLIVVVLCYFLNSYFPGKLLGYTSWMQLKDIIPSYGLAMFLSLSVYFLKFLPISNWIILPLQIALGTSLFFLICTNIKMQEYKEVQDILRPYLNKIRK